MSGRMCDQALAVSAAAAFLILLTWTVVVQPPANVFWAIPESIGKWLLLWTAVALLVGVHLEAAIEVRSWWRNRQDSGAAVDAGQTELVRRARDLSDVSGTAR
jgi:hypothetical protein